MPAFALFPWQVIYRAEGRNDGMVSVKSAQWGKHLATWQTDHWHTTNRRYSREARRIGDISPRYVEMLKAVEPD